MKKYTFLLMSLVFFAMNTYAQKTDANINGHVVEKKTGEHLPYINVILKNTTVGTSTDATGHYFLRDLPIGAYTLVVKSLGYKTQEKQVNIVKGKTLEVNFDLEDDDVSLNEIVVSSNRNETTRRSAPTLVSLLDVKTLERTNSATLAEGLNFQPGIRVENNCQNCGFTQVRMNGLGGAYSQILIDSRPIFSALTGVYGLEQIPANMVDRVEIVRGGGSALFGASAIAGTINIITKEPTRNTAQLSHTITSFGSKWNSFDNNTNFNASLVSDNQKMGAMVFGQSRSRSAYDHDGDGFSEMPTLKNRTLGFRSYIKTGLYSRLTFEYHNMNEFRRGGDRLNEESFNAYIAEQVESDINGGGAKYEMFSADGKQRFSIYSSAQLTNRKSYYGAGEPVSVILERNDDNALSDIENRLNSFGRTKGLTYVAGAQYDYNFDNFLFMPSTLTTGIEYNYDDIKDKSGFRDPIKQNINVASALFQNEWKDDKWGLLIGGRLDKHSKINNAIFSPRANVKYNPTKDVNLRISYGQGFRAPQLFDEDLHVDLAGGNHIISELAPNLKKEKSHSFSASADWYFQVGSAQINLLAEGFYTRLNNPFTSIQSEREKSATSNPDGSVSPADTVIVKTTINGPDAEVYGVNLEARAEIGSLFQFQMGLTIQRSKYKEAIKWSDDDNDNVKPERRMMRTPDVYGFAVATFTPIKLLSTSLSATYTGNMLVPHEKGYITENRTEKTPSFFDLGWKISYEVPLYKGSDIEFNAGVQNIFESYQKDFDKGPDRASSYIYGPSSPRSFFLGVKLCL